MNCPICDFLMRDDEVECRRCQHFAARRQAQSSFSNSSSTSASRITSKAPVSPHVPRQNVGNTSAANTVSGLNSGSPAPSVPEGVICPVCGKTSPAHSIFCQHCSAAFTAFSASPTTASPKHPAPRSGVARSIIIILVMLTVIVLSFLLLETLSRNQKQARIEQNKIYGIGQCVAGDDEGCKDAMDKLRDDGATDDAEFLKAHMMISISLEIISLSEGRQFSYRANGGATSAEYADYAKELYGEALVLAGSGDTNYSSMVSASETATYLSQYGPAHNLTGRY